MSRPGRGRLALRTVMIALAVVAVPLAWQVNRYRARVAAVAAIRQTGGRVLFDYQWADGVEKYDAESPAPRWLRRLLGDEAFHDVVSVQLAGSPRASEVAPHIAKFPKLRDLNLNNHLIRDADLACLDGLHSLERLSLWDAAITDAGLVHLRGLDRLTSLSLQGTAIGDAGMVELARHRGIINLGLTGTRVTDAALIRLRPLEKLRWLNLEDTAITDLGLDALLALPGLRSVCLMGTGVSDAGAAELIRASLRKHGTPIRLVPTQKSVFSF
jgi:hypothetical protein